MWLRLLGPTRIADGDVTLTAPKQRIILAALSCTPGQAVSPDRLGGLIWEQTCRSRAHTTIRSHVRALRQALGDDLGKRIVTTSSGYLLDTAPADIDTHEFTRRCAEASAATRHGDWQHAWDLLEEALRLWRGPALADVPCEVLHHDQVPSLDELRLQAARWHAEAGLALGRHQELAARLPALCRDHPLLEGLHAQLMLALYRCGRQAEALVVYDRARRSLATELGVDPGPELRDLHQRILTAEESLMPAGPVPRQLPPGPDGFTGRAAELAALTNGTGIIVITGAPGTGKTALAVHWAHRVARGFPDGQLFADLGGGRPGSPRPAEQVITGFLAALGVRPAPSILPNGQAPLLRSALAGKRMLIVLDNAGGSAEVEPLLPGDPGCLVLITSRNALPALTSRYGAKTITLEVLSDADSRQLLASRLGDRYAAPAMLGDLADSCGRLPLALAITAARAVTRPRLNLDDLAAELRDPGARLDALDAGEPAVNLRAVLSSSYQELDPRVASAFRLLALHPGPDITARAAASLLGVPLREALWLLEALTGAHLLGEGEPGRYAFHDLLRGYAGELASADGARHAAAQRMFDHYLHSAQAAARVLYRVRDPLALAGPRPGTLPEQFTGHAQALSWLRAEYRVLRAVGSSAGSREPAWQLPAILTEFMNRQGRWQDLADAHQAALTVAHDLGDRTALAHAYHGLGVACQGLGSFADSVAHLERAARLFTRLGDQARRARNMLALGVTFDRHGQHHAAWHQIGQALRLYRQLGHRPGHAVALTDLGWLAAGRQRYQLATGFCQRGLALHYDAGNDIGIGSTLDSLGEIQRRLGRPARSVGLYRQSVEALRRVDDRPALGRTLARLGDAYEAGADRRAARDAWQEALDVLDSVCQEDAARIRVKLHGTRLHAD
jgi:DNA-binding SARP family transcriptional activator/tetratricopeptide (TPR) repeat protein